MSLEALWRGARGSGEQQQQRLPQRFWLHLIDNFELNFVPKLSIKPHSITSLPSAVQAAQRKTYKDVARGIRYKNNKNKYNKLFNYETFILQEGAFSLPHPYQLEIETLPFEPPGKP